MMTDREKAAFGSFLNYLPDKAAEALFRFRDDLNGFTEVRLRRGAPLTV